jgi:glycosyltransferase involved in cell wall biosynthesis
MTIHGPYIFRAPEKWALGEKIKRSKFTICITEFTKSQCMIYIPHTEWHRLHIVHCGPDPAFLERDPPPLPEAPRMVWVGRICEEKAVPVLLEAARSLLADGVEFELAMVGDGPLRPMAEEMIAREGLQNHVRITGLITTEELVKLVVDSKLVVLPSFAEGLPAVIMEALAMRRPVISTYIAGIPELVEPGVSGWLVPAGSAGCLAAAMKEALATPMDRLEAMGERGRQAVLERHDPSVEAAKIAELIRRA